MNVLFGMNFPVLASVVLSVLALGTGAVWHFQRSHSYLLWLGGGLAALAINLGIFGALTPQAAYDVRLWLVMMMVLSHAALAHALALRMGRAARFWWVFGCALVCLLLIAMGTLAGADAKLAWWVSCVGTSAMLGHVLPGVWFAPKRRAAERGLAALLAAATAAYAVVPLLPALDPVLFKLAVVLPWVCLIFGVLITGLVAHIVLREGKARQSGRLDKDPTTGVLHREAFAAACGAQPRQHQFQVLALCDIDQLTRIEQEMGAPVAQEVLHQFSRILQNNVREGDCIAHLGAEAFAVALRNIDIDNAQMLMQRIRQRMRQQHWAYQSRVGPVTISVGLTVIRDTDSLDMAMHRADVLLYQSKECGRNHIWVDDVAQAPG